MAASQIGAAYVIIDEGYRSDPFSGAVSFERTFDGTSSDILALTATLLSQGARVSRRNSGGQNVLVAQWNRDPDIPPEQEPPPTDVWDDDTQSEFIDLFDMPEVLREARKAVSQRAAVSTNVYQDTNIVSVSSTAIYKKVIEHAIENGYDYPLDGDSYPVGKDVYNYLGSGVKSIEVHRPIITRSRVFSATYTPRNQMQYLPTVWTTEKLIEVFSIPASVTARFPETPSSEYTPDGTIWGWKLSVDRGTLNVGTGKVQEVRTWIYGNARRRLFTIVE